MEFANFICEAMSAAYEKDESFGESQQLDFHPDSMTSWLCDLKQIKVFP